MQHLYIPVGKEFHLMNHHHNRNNDYNSNINTRGAFPSMALELTSTVQQECTPTKFRRRVKAFVDLYGQPKEVPWR